MSEKGKDPAGRLGMTTSHGGSLPAGRPSADFPALSVFRVDTFSAIGRTSGIRASGGCDETPSGLRPSRFTILFTVCTGGCAGDDAARLLPLRQPRFGVLQPRRGRAGTAAIQRQHEPSDRHDTARQVPVRDRRLRHRCRGLVAEFQQHLRRVGNHKRGQGEQPHISASLCASPRKTRNSTSC